MALESVTRFLKIPSLGTSCAFIQWPSLCGFIRWKFESHSFFVTLLPPFTDCIKCIHSFASPYAFIHCFVLINSFIAFLCFPHTYFLFMNSSTFLIPVYFFISCFAYNPWAFIPWILFTHSPFIHLFFLYKYWNYSSTFNVNIVHFFTDCYRTSNEILIYTLSINHLKSHTLKYIYLFSKLFTLLTSDVLMYD